MVKSTTRTGTSDLPAPNTFIFDVHCALSLTTPADVVCTRQTGWPSASTPSEELPATSSVGYSPGLTPHGTTARPMPARHRFVSAVWMPFLGRAAPAWAATR